MPGGAAVYTRARRSETSKWLKGKAPSACGITTLQHWCFDVMRITITLEADVAARLREVSQRTGKSFKQAVNDAVREGLSSPAAVRAEPFVQPTHSMGRVTVDLTKALAMAADLEDQEVVAELRRG